MLLHLLTTDTFNPYTFKDTNQHFTTQHRLLLNKHATHRAAECKVEDEQSPGVAFRGARDVKGRPGEDAGSIKRS